MSPETLNDNPMTTTAPSPKMYRNSNFTVEEFNKLPIPERERINRDCEYKAKQAAEKTAPKPAPTPPDFEALAQQAQQVIEAAPGADATPAVLPDGAIYQTTDYDMFRIMSENREVSPNHIRKLVAQIGKRNLLYLNPIHVTSDMEVIDGQHRLSAARELGLPIFYRVGEQLRGEDIAMLNSVSKNWTGTDYLHYWTAKGSHDYQVLTAFMERHPAISFSNAKNMLSAPGKSKMDEFQNGQWRAGEVDKAELVANLMERIGNETSFKQSKDTRFVMALHYCVTEVEGFSPEKLMEKILANPRMLEPCATHKKYLEVFNEIYNYRTYEANRVRFL